MTTITLFAPRFRQEIEFPTTWNELQTEDVHAITNVLTTARKNQPQECFHALLSRRVKQSVLEKLNIEDMAAALPAVDFIFQEPPTINKPEHKQLQAADFDKNMTVAEFEDISPHLKKSTEDINAAATVAAILYRRPGVPYLSWNYKKNDYDTYDYDARIKNFLTLPHDWLYAVALYCIGQMHIVKSIFPEVFSGGSGAPDEMAFTKCIHAAAGPKNGTRAQVRATPLYEFLFEMQQEAIKAREIEELYKK